MPDTFNYLVKCGDKRRKLSTDDKNELPDLIRELFALAGSIRIQYEDPEWDNEIVDVSSPQDLPDRAKLHVKADNVVTEVTVVDVVDLPSDDIQSSPTPSCSTTEDIKPVSVGSR